MSFLSSLAGALCLIPLLLVLLMALSSAFRSRPALRELPPLRVTVARVQPVALGALEPGGGVAQALRARGALIAPVTLQVSSPDDPLQALEDVLGDLRLEPLCEPDQGGGEAVVAIRHPDLPHLLERLPFLPVQLRADAAQLLGPLREAAAAAQREGHDLLVLAGA